MLLSHCRYVVIEGQSGIREWARKKEMSRINLLSLARGCSSYCACKPSWCGRYPQSYCSVDRFFTAAEAAAFLCHCSGNVHSQ